MTTLTIHLDDEIAERARSQAKARGETLEQVLAREVGRLAQVEKRKAMVDRLLEISKRAGAEVGPIKWSRDDMYDR